MADDRRCPVLVFVAVDADGCALASKFECHRFRLLLRPGCDQLDYVSFFAFPVLSCRKVYDLPGLTGCKHGYIRHHLFRITHKVSNQCLKSASHSDNRFRVKEISVIHECCMEPIWIVADLEGQVELCSPPFHRKNFKGHSCAQARIFSAVIYAGKAVMEHEHGLN